MSSDSVALKGKVKYVVWEFGYNKRKVLGWHHKIVENDVGSEEFLSLACCKCGWLLCCVRCGILECNFGFPLRIKACKCFKPQVERVFKNE